jgi:hypothetical protein
MTTATDASSIAPRLVAALDRVWAAIRARHPEVPEVVLTLGAGSIGAARGTLRLGHFAAGRWQRGEGKLPEMFVAGEGLRRGAVDVLGTLLHEAAHGLADTRGIQDTSRQGRFHNARYRELAAELGLEVAKTDVIGWSDTNVPAGTAAAYRAELDELAAALVVYRHSEAQLGAGDRASNNNGVAARCACGRRIRVARTVLAAGPIVCGVCDTEFTSDESDESVASDG